MVRRTNLTLHPSPQHANFQGAFQKFGFIPENFRPSVDVVLEEIRLTGIRILEVGKVIRSLRSKQEKIFIGPERSEYSGCQPKRTDFFSV